MELHFDDCSIVPLYTIKVPTLLEFNRANRFHIERNFPTKQTDFYTLEAHQRHVLESLLNFERGDAYNFAVVGKGRKMIAKTSLYRVLHDNYSCANISVLVDYRHQHMGYGDKILKRMLKFAFEELKLHRVVAEVMPTNFPIIALLKKNGFTQEGIIRQSINVFGQWEDHAIFGLVNNSETTA
jgi:[ribosomal protein S5]-alanine N-acetyltransferase